MEEISRINRFEFELYIVHDGQFGALLDTGEWNGIVGEVRSGVRETLCNLTQKYVRIACALL